MVKDEDLKFSAKYEDCNIFKPGEVWQSPRGTLYQVQGYQDQGYAPHPALKKTLVKKTMQATLRKGLDGNGRKMLRDFDAVENWRRLREKDIEAIKNKLKVPK